MKSLRLLPLVFLLSMTSSLQLTFSQNPFEEGDRWTTIGDSITQGGEYRTWVYLYYLTRFPQMDFSVANAGISGDDTHGALTRYDWDVRPNEPTVASVMFGMNDVRREIYGDVPDTPQVRDQRTYILEGYRSFMRQLVARLQEDDVRLILMTPTIYDETAAHGQEVLTGVNGALGECALFVTELAETSGATLIDFYGPMNEINERIQEKDPSASLLRQDRVHPHSAGQFVMAYLFLRSIEAPGVVSRVCIDAANTKVLEFENATVDEMERSEGGLSFLVEAGAIPFPVGREQEEALQWVPFVEELNREELQVTGLPAGDYQLSIDDVVVRTYTAGELAMGVNLAWEKSTPQSLQAAEVLRLMKNWHKSEQAYRSIASFEYWSLSELEPPLSYEDAAATVEAEIERLQEYTEGPQSWRRKSFEDYRARKSSESEMSEELEEGIAAIRLAAQPKVRRYRIERVGD